jgi:molybdenum cofactor cytidylyltransferase
VIDQRPASPRPAASAPVDAIVLAAGRSARMGRPKPLLRVGDESFVERAVRVLQEGGCRGVTVVVSDVAAEAARLAEQAGARIVVNDDAESEPIDSIRLALAILPDDTAWVAILPVDHPLVEPGTITRLIAAAHARGGAIVRPVYQGAPGHPGLYARRTFPDFFRPDLERGAHSVVEAFGDEVVDIPVDDPGVRADLNTPEELRHWLGREAS